MIVHLLYVRKNTDDTREQRHSRKAALESTVLQLGSGQRQQMAPSQVSEAELSLDRTGRYVDANGAALELLGVSLPELLASPPERFRIEPADEGDQASLRKEWALSLIHI